MLRRSIAPAVAIACMGSVAAAAELTVIEAPGGYMTSVSADGSVVAGYGGQFFYWTKKTGSIFIGGIPPGFQGAGGSAAVSDDGTRVLGNVLNNDSKVEAAIWQINGVEWQPIGNLGSNCDINSSTGWGMSGDGLTVVGGVYPSFCTHRAMKWSQGGAMSTLFSWFGWTTRANGANQNGSVVYGWQDIDTGFRQGCIWTGNVQTRLATTAGVRMGEAQCCTADGATVFGFGNFNDGNGQVPYRWTNAAKAVPLGPDSEDAPGYATGCSADGNIVSCFFRWGPPAVSGEGYAWINGRGYVPLETLATENGIAVPEGLRLSLPLDVSADGKTIVGSGRDVLGGQVIFVLDLHADALPCTPDVTGDGAVDGADLGALLSNWGQSGQGDLDGNGFIDGADLGSMLVAWGPCP